jgi:DNA-binding transcriptional MerR regulator
MAKIPVFLLHLLLLIDGHAFAPLASVSSRRVVALREGTLPSDNDTTTNIRQDIEAMRQEAMQRLDALSEQMEDLKRENQCYHEQESNHYVSTARTPTASAPSSTDLGSVKGKVPAQDVPVSELKTNSETSSKQLETDNILKSHTSKALESKNTLPTTSKPRRLDLLDNTRWKLVFNIGRETGTWMPAGWGASGKRLCFQVVADLSSDPLYDTEDFFHGSSGGKVLNVKDAFVLPHGNVGRRPVKVKSTGGYKVVAGQGPMGTDVVRMYVELEEAIFAGGNKELYCPAGRVYGTCGYFPMESFQHNLDQPGCKDACAREYHAVLREYEVLQASMQEDSRVFALEKIKMMKTLYDKKRQLQDTAKRLQQAQQREPERSQLRLSRNGDVALSREGGVCCKVHKGLALEYHILGRMELGSIDVRNEHDEYEDLVHGLHP